MPTKPLTQAAALLAIAFTAAAHAEDFTLPHNCVVGLVDDIELHATEAGILDHVGVKEGARVRAEDVLVQIDTSEAKKARQVAKYALRRAVEAARDDVEIRYAEASLKVAEATVLELEETISKVAKAVTEADIREARLNANKAKLQIEKAKHDQELANLDAWTKKAELEAAEMAIERRTLRAPFNGVVQKKYRDEKEWVNPGDPILRLIRLDELQVEGSVPLAQHTPAELDGCEVTITVPSGGGKTATATGRIVYIDPILMRGADGQEAKVRAEVTNREQNGHWTILPMMNARMTIHLGTGGVAAAQRTDIEER